MNKETLAESMTDVCLVRSREFFGDSVIIDDNPFFSFSSFSASFRGFPELLFIVTRYHIMHAMDSTSRLM
jgi:hypothetical protein